MTMSYEITRTLHLHILVSLLVPCASCSLVFFFSLACFGTFFTLLRRPLTVIIPSKKHLMKLFIPRAHNWNFTVQIQYECWECCKTPHNYPEHQASFLHFLTSHVLLCRSRQQTGSVFSLRLLCRCL